MAQAKEDTIDEVIFTENKVDSAIYENYELLNEEIRKIAAIYGVRVWSQEDLRTISKEAKVKKLNKFNDRTTYLMEGEGFKWVAKRVTMKSARVFRTEVFALCCLRFVEGVQEIEAVYLSKEHQMLVSKYAGVTVLSAIHLFGHPQAREAIYQVWQTIRRIHEHGFVHNDLHVDNVCVQFDEGGGVSITVIDFGYAARLPNAFKNNDFICCVDIEKMLLESYER